MPSPNLRVIEIDPFTDERWDECVKSVPESLIYHHSAWLKVLEEAYGCSFFNLACEDDDGRVLGIFPISLKRGILTGRVLSSLYSTPVAGPLAHNPSALAVLIRAAVERVQLQRDIPLELKVLSNALDQAMPNFIGVPVQTSYVVHLPESPDLLRLGKPDNHASIKRAVKKASRLGVQVRLAKTERELWDWYGLYLKTMQRLSALPQSYQLFKSAWKQLHGRGLMQLLIAEHCHEQQSKLIGGLVLLTFGHTTHYAYGGWSWEHQSLRPNDALHWEAIQLACANGFKRYDLGAAPLNQGLAQYKSKWGAQPEPIYSYRYFAKSNFPVGTSKSSSVGLNLSGNIHAPESLIRQCALNILGRLPSGAVAAISKWAHQI